MASETGRLRKQPQCSVYASRDQKAGDRLFKPQPELEGAHIIDLVKSRGTFKRCSDKLIKRVVRKHGRPRLAFMDDNGVWYWED